MTETAPRLPRRERVRQATVEEIKTVARAQMAAEGTAGVTLRAIAREMGMTAPALYRYFASRDDLVTALVIDAYDALADAMEAAVEAVRTEGRHADRLRAAFGAFRAWGLEHPTEFALIFGSPIPGYVAPEATRPAGTRYTNLLAGLLVEAHAAGALDPAGIDLRVPDGLSRQLQDLQRRGGFRGAPVPVVAFGLSAWTRLHGLVTLEVFGHLAPAVGDGAALFEQELDAIIRQSGLRG
ncbi:MAG TPA: TetR/AcrR family transcriptional regulator [Actinomycetota bacterium]|nr:TetR/AcrR family transcriptional regulator [Actinomycetota bacterium]